VIDCIVQTNRLVISRRESSVPMSYVDADKKPRGYSLDLRLRIAEVEETVESAALGGGLFSDGSSKADPRDR
jgi:glutamate/aspartate transport system substrate-binding protein